MTTSTTKDNTIRLQYCDVRANYDFKSYTGTARFKDSNSEITISLTPQQAGAIVLMCGNAIYEAGKQQLARFTEAALDVAQPALEHKEDTND